MDNGKNPGVPERIHPSIGMKNGKSIGGKIFCLLSFGPKHQGSMSCRVAMGT